MTKKKNIAFIDGQNLHISTQTAGWSIDNIKFRIYLQDKYSVNEVYYFLGYFDEQYQSLYTSLQKAGFIILFKEHLLASGSKKKGNVDTTLFLK